MDTDESGGVRSWKGGRGVCLSSVLLLKQTLDKQGPLFTGLISCASHVGWLCSHDKYGVGLTETKAFLVDLGKLSQVFVRLLWGVENGTRLPTKNGTLGSPTELQRGRTAKMILPRGPWLRVIGVGRDAPCRRVAPVLSIKLGLVTTDLLVRFPSSALLSCRASSPLHTTTHTQYIRRYRSLALTVSTVPFQYGTNAIFMCLDDWASPTNLNKHCGFCASRTGVYRHGKDRGRKSVTELCTTIG